MKKKIFLFLIILFIVLNQIVLVWMKNDVPTSRKEIFKEYQVHFEIIKDFILAEPLAKSQSETYILTYDDKREKIVDIYGISQTLTERELESLNLILEIFRYDFSFIEVDGNRVNFGGDGSDMFIYSINGKSPKWFYYRFDGLSFSRERLSEKWFYLYHHIR